MTQEDLNAIRQIMKEELKPINQRLDTMDQRMNNIEENLAEVRTGVNTLLEWADRVSDTYQFPLPAIGE